MADILLLALISVGINLLTFDPSPSSPSMILQKECGSSFCRSDAAAALRPIDEMNDAEDLGPHWFFPSKMRPESKDIL